MFNPKLALFAALVLLLSVAFRGASEETSGEHAGPMPMFGTDQRTPLPLPLIMAEHQKQNMRDHLAAVERIVAGLAKDDFEAIATAAARIGYSESMGQMCEHMGAASPGFTPMAINFHHTADRIREAARSGDRRAVLEALQATLRTCVDCHATYRQQVVDEATWKRLVEKRPPSE